MGSVDITAMGAGRRGNIYRWKIFLNDLLLWFGMEVYGFSVI